MSNFIVGDVARLSVSILDVAGVPSDPTSLSLVIQAPDGTSMTHTSDIVKDSTGNYHFDLALDSSGSYGYRWQSVGTNRGAIEGGVFVSPWRI